ncbi:3-oxo-5alpha-steroid 4-dehydrogenase [Panacagrimonas perspica]|uniref:3-oxo-5alpha-steroid 4-dehydrogenase n=1 Tax=Panacagrimonas perspica TaxID=381431 RepID=A0A4S3K1B4_9GAMM|nr:FAD-binding protein [Panacagrimonas perspica]TDU31128.1 3-oxo-5alpha-steroid 4-dehydrogenase [Panacagrimonas perspica]THD01737.1 delta 4, 5-alpha steroid dehydrogenase [Panacagrimonas perspica]
MSDSSSPTPAKPDGTLPIEAPLTVADPASTRYDRECDVLVVGFGAAGAAAAIAAREAGADVVILDRFGGGGATALSGGVVYAGGGTRQQRHFGYADTADAMFRYLRNETGDAVSDEQLKRFCDDSRGLIEWLESTGACFDSTVPPPKTSYPPDGTYLYYSGNEPVPAFAAHAEPAPRGHRAQGTWMSGKNLFEHLRTRIRQLEIPVIEQFSVRRLLQDAQGRIVGAEAAGFDAGSALALHHQRLIERAEKVHNLFPGWADGLRAKALVLETRVARHVTIRARRGVILCTGGFIFNREMVAQNAPKYRGTLRLGATGCDGSGIRLGESVGGVPTRMEKVSAWRFINPPQNLPRGIVVNGLGVRFCNEQVYGARLGVEMVENHGGKAWLILDAPLRKAAIRECLKSKAWPFQKYPALLLMLFAQRGNTPEELASKIGVPPQALRETIARYDADASSGAADVLGKADDMRARLHQGPFYALDIAVTNRMFPCPAITLGGLRVDEDSNSVVDAQSQPIPGLYAAGRTAVGIASNHYVSGLSLADCLWSGRRAGRHAAGG